MFCQLHVADHYTSTSLDLMAVKPRHRQEYKKRPMTKYRQSKIYQVPRHHTTMNLQRKGVSPGGHYWDYYNGTSLSMSSHCNLLFASYLPSSSTVLLLSLPYLQPSFNVFQVQTNGHDINDNVNNDWQSGPTFIKPDQLDPWIKDQLRNDQPWVLFYMKKPV